MHWQFILLIVSASIFVVNIVAGMIIKRSVARRLDDYDGAGGVVAARNCPGRGVGVVSDDGE